GFRSNSKKGALPSISLRRSWSFGSLRRCYILVSSDSRRGKRNHRIRGGCTEENRTLAPCKGFFHPPPTTPDRRPRQLSTLPDLMQPSHRESCHRKAAESPQLHWLPREGWP